MIGRGFEGNLQIVVFDFGELYFLGSREREKMRIYLFIFYFFPRILLLAFDHDT